MVWKTLFCCGVVPAAVTFLGTCLGARRRVASAALAVGAFSLALAVAAGYLLSVWALRIGPLVPVDGWHWWPWLAWLQLLPAVMASLPRVPSAAIGGCLVVVVVASAWLLVPRWPSLAADRPGYVAGASLTMLCGAVLVERALDRKAWFAVSVALAAVLLLCAGVQLQAGSLRFAQLAGLLTAGWAGGVLGARLAGTPGVLKGMAGSCVVMLVGLVLTGHLNTFDQAPAASFALLAAAPVAIGLCGLRSPEAGAAWWIRALWLAGLALPAGLAMILAI